MPHCRTQSAQFACTTALPRQTAATRRSESLLFRAHGTAHVVSGAPSIPPTARQVQAGDGTDMVHGCAKSDRRHEMRGLSSVSTRAHVSRVRWVWEYGCAAGFQRVALHHCDHERPPHPFHRRQRARTRWQRRDEVTRHTSGVSAPGCGCHAVLQAKCAGRAVQAGKWHTPNTLVGEWAN